jgi:putative hemolysin
MANMNAVKTPMNDAEHPLFVMSELVTAEIITMVNAAGQNCKSVGWADEKAHEQSGLRCTPERHVDGSCRCGPHVRWRDIFRRSHRKQLVIF